MSIFDIFLNAINTSRVQYNANADELRQRLSHDIVRFTYRMRDGKVRKAVGTRNLNLLRRIGIYVPYPKRSGHHNPNCYYDLEVRGWRSYCPERIISIEG
jgi:hypothetical protein